MGRWTLIIAAALAICQAQQIIEIVEVDLPNELTTCSRNSAERDTCLRNAISSAITQLRGGHEQLGLRALDPMLQPEFKTGFDAGVMRSKMTARNVRTFGLSSIEIRDVQSEITDNSLDMEVDVYIPKLVTEGIYKGDSSFGDYQVNSRGVFNLTMIDITATWKVEGQAEERDGQTYMRIKHFRMRPTVGDMKVYASGLLPDEGLNNAALAFINQYWQSVYQALLPYAEANWDPVMTNILNELFLRIPYNKLMPVE